MNKLITVLVFLLSVQNAFTQEVVSSAGETQEAGGYEFSWTLGEPAILTFSAGSNILTQGFHQSKLIVTAIDEPGLLVSELKVYPNPTSDYVVIHLDSEIQDKQYSLFDMNGKIIRIDPISDTDTRIDVSALATGAYLLHIGTTKSDRIQSFKIVKK